MHAKFQAGSRNIRKQAVGAGFAQSRAFIKTERQLQAAFLF
jgi:hypothetical protein